MIEKIADINFPTFSGIRCLMMPYIQGDSCSIPEVYAPYRDIVDSIFVERGKIGFLTIDESMVQLGNPHRGARSRYPRALHTEAGKRDRAFVWGTWGSNFNVTLDRGVRVLLANNLERSCAIWDADQEDTTLDGDIGHMADDYPYSEGIYLSPGQVYDIGIFTPHESLPVSRNFDRQFLRIVSSEVHGREDYFTQNPLCPL